MTSNFKNSHKELIKNPPFFNISVRSKINDVYTKYIRIQGLKDRWRYLIALVLCC